MKYAIKARLGEWIQIIGKSGRRMAASVCCLAIVTGCEVDSFFDPSKTGRFEFEPTTIPVLDRLDVIESEPVYWSNATPPTAEDLMPRDLVYYIYPGDVITVSIYELTTPNEWDVKLRRVDASGFYRIPELGDVRAAGLTAQQFEDEVTALLRQAGFTTPQADVVIEQGGGLRYTVSGNVPRPGQYNLDNPNLRLIEALASAGGVPQTTERIYVVRQVILSPEVQPEFERDAGTRRRETPTGVAPRPPQPDIEELLRQLEDQPMPQDRPNVPPQDFPEEPSEPPPSIPDFAPGMLQDATAPPNGVPPTVDIDQLEPVRPPQEPPVDVDAVRQPPRRGETDETPIYDPQRGEWIRVPSSTSPTALPPGTVQLPQATGETAGQPAILTRIVELNYQRMYRGDSSQNIVVRPNDQIYVEAPEQGFWYIEGEIGRGAGVFGLPSSGTLTLSRAIAAAGGLGAIAAPTRVDLTRKVGHNREATIRLDLAAIRQRTEPDVVLKPDDHIIVGTSFWATPLAIFRSGFRMTYGFGFLLDRNFGPDVFGAQPGQIGF